MRDNMPAEIRSLIAQCEANVSSFTNDQMSAALHYAETTLLKLERLQDSIWPGLPPFVSTPEKPQEDFYILAAEGCRGELQQCVRLRQLVRQLRCEVWHAYSGTRYVPATREQWDTETESLLEKP